MRIRNSFFELKLIKIFKSKPSMTFRIQKGGGGGQWRTDHFKI